MPLEITEDPAFARKEWRAQHIGWFCIVLIVMAALVGILGQDRFGSVLRTAAVYAFLVVIFRISGRRTLAEITTFDLLLVLIISEATQQAMIGRDQSVVNAIVVISTLVGLDIFLSLLKLRYSKAGKILDGLPVIVLRDGKILEDRAKQERIDKEDILAEARRAHGLERLDQIKYAVVEESGGLSIVPKKLSKD